MLEDLLAESILQDAFLAGDTVVVDAAGGKLAVNTLVVAHESLSTNNNNGQQEIVYR
jgi:hypothetical protein